MRIVLFLIMLSFTGRLLHSGTDERLPRTVIAVYKLDEAEGQTDLFFSRLHYAAEMPLNHLGLKVEYHNIDRPLPDLSGRTDVAGILTWFNQGEDLPRQVSYLKWLLKQLDEKRKLLILGEPGFDSGSKNIVISSLAKIVWKRLGVKHSGDWTVPSSKSNVKVLNPKAYFFEQKLSEYYGYSHVEPLDSSAEQLLNITSEGRTSTLAFTHQNGGHIAPGYLIHPANDNLSSIQWYINPFYLFNKVFQLSALPKPDVTTVSGRRIFFSHIDGDGWNNMSHIKDTNGINLSCTEVIYQKVIKAFPDLPVTVGPVVSDLTSTNLRNAQSLTMAKLMLNAKNTEPATHTVSHPFDWGFFADYSTEKEQPYQKIYKEVYDKYSQKDSSLKSLLKNYFNTDGITTHRYYNENYATPRAYALTPFSVKKETKEGCLAIDKLLKNGRKTEVILLSGNCRPFEEVLKFCRENEIKVINGGDSRLDSLFPSYRWVSPIGRQVGSEQQIYAAASNENTYTKLWTENFGGFANLSHTITRTESPLRVKPVNVYYHIYSGEREASINAVVSNLQFARSQKICPIATGDYIDIAKGFYNCEFIRFGQGWKVSRRGALQTIRYDNAVLKRVDFANSSGVIGQKHHQGSLYVALDRSCETPLIRLTENETFWMLPAADQPYLIESRQQVADLKLEPKQFSFTTKGFGPIHCEWFLPEPGQYTVKCNNTLSGTFKTDGHRLLITLPEQPLLTNRLSIIRNSF